LSPRTRDTIITYTAYDSTRTIYIGETSTWWHEPAKIFGTGIAAVVLYELIKALK
jgi:hypothetical protein